MTSLPVGKKLCHAVRTSGIEWSFLVLRNFLHFPIQLWSGGLVEPKRNKKLEWEYFLIGKWGIIGSPHRSVVKWTHWDWEFNRNESNFWQSQQISESHLIVLDNPQVLMASKSRRVPTPSTSAVYSAKSNQTFNKERVIDKFVEYCTGVCPGLSVCLSVCHSLTHSHSKLM